MNVVHPVAGSFPGRSDDFSSSSTRPNQRWRPPILFNTQRMPFTLVKAVWVPSLPRVYT